jgi:hypothetical protein
MPRQLDRIPPVLAAIAGVIAACNPAITTGEASARRDAGRPPDPLPSADAGGAPTCREGETSCTADQAAVQRCTSGAWRPETSCRPGEELCQRGACLACGKFHFTIDTKQSCSLSVLPGFKVDAESFIRLEGKDYRVFAMTRWGKGHLVAWCDATTLGSLLAAFRVEEYLGQRVSPRVASFGDKYLCRPGALATSGVPRLPDSITYLGETLPEGYLDDPASLAADWDVLVYCGFRVPMPQDLPPALVPFVERDGKGLLAVMDYMGPAVGITTADFDRMNAVTAKAGIQFDSNNLAWAPASTEVVLECVPDLIP